MAMSEEPSARAQHWRVAAPKLPRWASPLFGLILFVAAIFVIHAELGGRELLHISSALRAMAPSAIWFAVGWVVLSFACLIGAESLALSLIGKPMPLARMWRASFTAYALGNALGFSFATAPAARARLYGDALKPEEVAAVSALTAGGVFTSAAFAAGLGLLVGAGEIATHGFGYPLGWRIFGAVLILPAIGWVLLALGGARSASIGGVSFRTPRMDVALSQVGLGLADWVAAASVLYVLLPSHGGWSFPAFLAVFVGSGMLGGVSGAPGGLGVFEASILALAPATQQAPGTVAALLAYRLIYTLAPLAGAALLLARDMIASAKSPAARVAGRLGAAAVELAPQIFAALAFASGLVLLLSSATPAVAARLHFLTRVAPLLVVELSHFIASLTGVLLLVVAAALWRRLEGAYVAALALLAVGALAALFKGVDVEEAIVLGIVALALYPCRHAFTRKSRLLSEPLSLAWLAAVSGAAIGAGWLGFFAFRNVAYSDDLWWTFLRNAEVSRFLRAAAGAAMLIAGLSIWSLLASPRLGWRGKPSAVDVERARAAMAGAEDMRGDANLALLGDKDLLFSPSGKSYIMFRARGRHWIAMSEPCGLLRERRALMWRFAELADEAGASPAFYSVTEALLPDIAELGMVARKIGETAIVRLPEFGLEGKARGGLRTARNRVEREGGAFEMLPPGAASANAEALRAISDTWLANHAGAEKAFSLGRFDIGYLDRTPLAIVRQEGRIVAFANVWTTPDRREITVDLMRYSEAAPKNVMDYLFIKLFEWGKEAGFKEFDLGMAPLAGLDAHRLAPAFARVGAVMFEDGESLYGFRGLRAYKEKFDPEWRPLYLAARPGAMAAYAMLDVALLTSGGWRGLFARG